MKLAKLSSLMKEHTNEEGVLNEKDFHQAVNQHYDGVKITAIEEAEKKMNVEELKDGAVADFLKGKGFNDEASLVAQLKNGATAETERLKADLAKVEKERDEFNKQVDELTPFKAEATEMKQLKILRDSAVQESHLDFIHFGVNKMEGETFDDKLAEYKKTNPNYFENSPSQKNTHLRNTGKPNNGVDLNGDKPGWMKILEQKTGVDLE